MKAQIILVLLLFSGCSEQLAQEQVAVDRAWAMWNRDFPERMVICDVETGKAYIATRGKGYDPAPVTYGVEDFPGPNWKCPAFDSGVKTP